MPKKAPLKFNQALFAGKQPDFPVRPALAPAWREQAHGCRHSTCFLLLVHSKNTNRGGIT
jgi:hypothetical protein